MAKRSLLEVFIIMRNNSLQSRNIYSDRHDYDDRSALVSRNDHSIDMKDIELSPDWADTVEEIQYEITRIKSKKKELFILHDRHLNRPSFDDSFKETNAIEVITQEITQTLSRCRRLVQQINASGNTRRTDKKLTHNIVASLARTLQEISTNFRIGQSAYLKKINERNHNMEMFSDDTHVLSQHERETNDLFRRGFTDDQQMVLEQNYVDIEQRSEETMQICRSIEELNDIFKDLASFVTDQGTVLDRIDFNIEQTHNQVDSGLKQLQKASNYQKKNRKMYIILVLAAITTFLTFLLILIKS